MPFDLNNPPDKIRKLSPKKQRQWIGLRFGQLVIIEQMIGKRGRPVMLFRCRCDCGEEKIIEGDRLYRKKGRTVKSCGCSMDKKPIRDNLAGTRFGRLLVIKKAKKTNYWSCKCDCGVCKDIFRGNLMRGLSVSCGCWKTNGDWIKRGEEHHSWDPQLSDEDRRKQKIHWGWSNRITQKIFKRDDYTCLACNTRGCQLATHHLDGWNWCKEKRFDKNNIITICVECHINFHKLFGYGNNNIGQFKVFLEERYAV